MLSPEEPIGVAISRNRTILETVDRHLHMLQQGILPPDAEEQALKIWPKRKDAIAGLLAARLRDKENFEHILNHYYAMQQV